MIINLKQTEIEQALRAYVVSQGISLHGKDLTISFTAGRRESGISAEISIDDVEIPGYTNSIVADAPVTKSAVLSLAPAVATVTPVAVEAVEEVQQVEQEEVAVESAEEAPVETKTTVSLFG